MNHDIVRLTGDGISLGIIAATIVNLLPAFAALCSVVWYGILFYEKFTQKNKDATPSKKN